MANSTYITKSGEVRTYNKGSLKLFNKNGSIAKPWLNNVTKALGLDELDYITELEIAETVRRLHEDKGVAVDRLTPQYVAAIYRGDRLATMVLNTGNSIEETAKMVKTNTTLLLDEANWFFKGDESYFINKDTNKVYKFTFTYQGNVFAEVYDGNY